MWIVLYGNVRDGHIVVGPFKSHDDAAEWCDEHDTSYSNVVELTDPSDV